ncbi:NUT family member 2G-like [Manis pentadactyla]|uniref:NUT family member 2G-like n=1 Tax=Manis pentadactyla TaxID=143292 RepID=UPI00255C7ED7|nr:NUT family member 2G-like [Manis pentadactyla]
MTPFISESSSGAASARRREPARCWRPAAARASPPTPGSEDAAATSPPALGGASRRGPPTGRSAVGPAPRARAQRERSAARDPGSRWSRWSARPEPARSLGVWRACARRARRSGNPRLAGPGFRVPGRRSRASFPPPVDCAPPARTLRSAAGPTHRGLAASQPSCLTGLTGLLHFVSPSRHLLSACRFPGEHASAWRVAGTPSSVERPSSCGRISACGDDFRRSAASATPVLGPPHWAPWQQHPPNVLGPVLPPGSTLVLPTLPSTPLVAAQASCGPGWPGACNVTVHFLAASGVKTILPAPPAWSTQASDEGWSLHRPPRAAVPAAQLASGGLPALASPRPPGAARNSGPACSQPTASPGNACHRTSVNEKFRRWQHCKPLARRHLPQSPDAEALSCFLIPVLRTLARRNPTMTREEVLQRGVQKWHCLSKSERSIYYVMAGRFMEFEAEEARQCQNAQWMKAAQGVPHPAPLRPVPRAPSAPERGQKRAGHDPPRECPRAPSSLSTLSAGKVRPAYPHSFPAPSSARIREKASAGAQSANAQPPRCRQSPHTEAPTEIPLEAVAEGLEIMEGLLGPSGPTQGLPGEERGEDSSKPPQGEEGVYPDPGLLTYINELCAQGDFLNKADAVLHPRFLAELPCPEAQLDLLALAEELEQEEGLSLLEQKRLLELKQEEGVQAPASHGTPRLDSRPSGSEAGQDPQRHGHGPQLGASDQACPPESGCGQRQAHSRGDAGVWRPEAFAASPGRQEPPPLKAGWRPHAPQARCRTSPSLGPRLATAPGETCPARESLGPTGRPSEGEEELPSLAFLLASQHTLPSWGLPQSPTPGSDLLRPGVPQARSPQKPGLSPAGPPAGKASSRAPCAGPAPAGKTPLPGASLGGAGEPALALGLGCPSQPRKRRGDPFGTGKGRKRPCSQ